MLGFTSKEELLSVNLLGDITHDPCKRAQLLGHPSEEEQAGPVQADWKRKDGTTLTVLLSAREVASEGGDMNCFEVIAEDVTKQRVLEDHLRQQAAKDPLTGLANYRHLVDVLDNEIKRSKRTKREFALLMLDLDGLKRINDRHGHMTGSQALCRLADALCICCRDTDTPARFGGDEFALVLPETQAQAAGLVAHRIRERLANDGKEPKLSVTVGIAIYPTDAQNIDALLSAADVAMYSAKGQGRDLSLPATTSQREIARGGHDPSDRTWNAKGLQV
jgi:diguanylate cyclase (GGDEF)-like protein